jgi:hypothetical protein
MSSVDLYKKMRGGEDSDFLDFLLLFHQGKSKREINYLLLVITPTMAQLLKYNFNTSHAIYP